jgi:hypothetical protein
MRYHVSIREKPALVFVFEDMNRARELARILNENGQCATITTDQVTPDATDSPVTPPSGESGRSRSASAQ